MRIADIDGDGDADLWGGNWNGRGVHIYRNDLKGLSLDRWRRRPLDDETAARAAAAGTVDLDGRALDAGDLDYDGDRDLLVAGPGPEDPGGAGLRILENVDGAGRQWRPHPLSADGLADAATLVDVDDDGDLDVVATGPGDAPGVLYENRAVTRPWWCPLVGCR
jgi:hypothetical protein